jgi:hypothetical protein
MPVREWVIDTYVLYKADEPKDDEHYLPAIGLLRAIEKGHRLVLDSDGHIRKQYEDCIRQTRSPFLQSWYKQMFSRAGAIVSCSGKLPARRHTHLVDKLKFDTSDVPFVAVAVLSADHLVVSEDSDYTDEVKQYLAEKLSVQVLGIREAEDTL